MKKTALVTSIGSFSAEIVIKRLIENGFIVIGTDMYRKECIANALFVTRFYQVPPVENETAYETAIIDLCMKEKITHILPLTDVDVDYFNRKRDYCIKNNINLCISPADTINLCRDKLKQFEYINANLPEIKTIPTRIAWECDDIPFPLPLIAKPVDGRSSQGIVKIFSVEDWNTFKTSKQMDKYIVQPFLEGSITTVDILRLDDMYVVAVPRVEFLRTHNGAGLSVKVFSDAILEAVCRRLACAFNIVGCACFEFIADDSGEYAYLECNPRFSAGVKFSIMAGYDFVTNHLRCFDNKAIDDLTSVREMYIARRYEEFITD